MCKAWRMSSCYSVLNSWSQSSCPYVNEWKARHRVAPFLLFYYKSSRPLFNIVNARRLSLPNKNAGHSRSVHAIHIIWYDSSSSSSQRWWVLKDRRSIVCIYLPVCGCNTFYFAVSVFIAPAKMGRQLLLIIVGINSHTSITGDHT